LLNQFLRHCDLVKFAEHHPGKEDVDESLEKCKQFILQTKKEKFDVVDAEPIMT